jgi:hypothetical protein
MRWWIALLVLTGLSACASQPAHKHRESGMGIDAFGHTQMADERTSVEPDRLAHVDRLIAALRASLPRYRDVEMALADGYRPTGESVPIGALKHFVSSDNVRINWQHLDPQRPMALLYRRTKVGYDLAGVMFTAPIVSSMDELDKRIPLALGHWHSHRHVCQPKPGHAPLDKAEQRAFGFSGSIHTEAECRVAGGVFLDNVYGWMVHVYPFETEIAKQF